MSKRISYRVFPRAVVALLALMIAAGPWIGVVHHTAHASAIEPLNLTVEVSYKGFNGESEFSIEALQGQEVNLTFVWADGAVPDNAHRIRIEGYELKTKIIDIDNPEDTLSFVADKTGSFLIECDWRCEGHKEALQSATLKVGGSSPDSGPGASYVSTNIALGFMPVETEAGPVALDATLQDEEGQAIEGAPVRFYVATEFAGTDGLMEIAEVQTGEDGVALYEYTPTVSGEQTIIARFDGLGLYEETEASFPINVRNAEPAYTVPPPGLEGLRQWAPLGVGLIVATVWLTFMYAGFQVYRLARSPGGGGADEL